MVKIQYVCPQCGKANDKNVVRCDCGRPLRLEVNIKPDDLRTIKREKADATAR